MGDWLNRLLPWYDNEAQMKKERKTEANRLKAQRAIKRSDALLQAYVSASITIRKEKA